MESFYTGPFEVPATIKGAACLEVIDPALE